MCVPEATAANVAVTAILQIISDAELESDLPPGELQLRLWQSSTTSSTTSKQRLQRIKAAVVMSEWQAPRELPDLRRVDNNIVALDTEENDEGLRAGRGSGGPGRRLGLRHLGRLA